MSLSNKYCVLVGYSGHGCVVADAAHASGLQLGFYSDKQKKLKNPYHLKYLGTEQDKNFKGWDREYKFILGIGDNVNREKIGLLIEKRKEELVTVIHPDASISDLSSVGLGTFVSRGACINPLADIGNYVILNTGCVVEHECRIGNAAHIAPGAVLAGNVSIGLRSFIGANSVIREGINIGNDVFVGAGAVVVKDIPDGRTVFGNPAREGTV